VNQGSSYLVKTRWPDFSLSWHKVKWEKIWETSEKLAKFNRFFPQNYMSPMFFHKINMLHNDLKNDAIKEFGIKWWTLNSAWLKFQEHGTFTWILKKKYDYWWKKYWLKKTDKVTKTSLFGRNRTISLKLRWKSHPLCLVWWALMNMWKPFTW
jgi:hypothetical protein